MDSKTHVRRIHRRVKGPDKSPLILISDSISVYKIFSISELLQSRKYKINPKDITERFWLSLFHSSVISQIVEKVCTAKWFYF